MRRSRSRAARSRIGTPIARKRSRGAEAATSTALRRSPRARRSSKAVTRALPGLTSTHLWAHSCFSDVEGYPQLVGMWGGRLIYIKDIDLIASVVGDFWNMSPVNDDGVFSPDMAFRLRLNISDPPTWL